MSSVAQQSPKERVQNGNQSADGDESESVNRLANPEVAEKVNTISRIQSALQAAISVNEHIEKNALFALIA